jgi:hypothetical protein
MFIKIINLFYWTSNSKIELYLDFKDPGSEHLFSYEKQNEKERTFANAWS